MALDESKADQLVADYLRELKVSAWMRQLPRSEAEALENDVRAKIAAALDAADGRDEATVQEVLDRLGSPSTFVSGLVDQPRSGLRGALDGVLAPFVRLRDVHGWGLAEICGLLLLIVGPFYVGWIGPIFGIILVRAAADRWSDRVEHRATVVVASLFGLQVVIALALIGIMLTGGGLLGEQLWELFSLVGLGRANDSPINLPSPGGAGLLTPVEIIVAAPAFIAGIGSGIYLALSPRHRPRPMV